MSARCIVCGKGSLVGNLVSHSNIKTKHRYKPNLQRIRIVWNGGRIRAAVCTKCMKAGKVLKAI